MKDLGIYIHFPFCSNICSYCDFVVDKNLNLIDKYIDTLIIEIENKSNSLQSLNDYQIKTIYFGGGTPSLMSESHLQRVLSSLKDNFNLNNVEEISLESNPNSIPIDKLNNIHNLGVNRLSIGVQTFIKRELGVLKRNHSPKKALSAINEALSIGFDSVNIDLIYSIPNQSEDDWKYNLNIIKDLEIDHISCYNLTYEENTPLYKKLIDGKINKNNEEFESDLYLYTSNYLEKLGFEHYEVSNYAKEDKRCKHNLSIWENNEYLGFGVGAHWKFNNIRYENTRNLKVYIESVNNNLNYQNIKELSSVELFEEYIILGLRSQGVGVDYLEKFLNKKFKLKENKILINLIENEFLQINNLNIKLTNKGYLFADSISYEIMKIINLI